MKSLWRLLRRWHRWLGVLALAPLLVLSVTGILLNHLDELGFGSRPMPLWLAESYGFKPPEQFVGTQLESGWLAVVAERLIVDGKPVADCSSPFRGAVSLGDRSVAACDQTLVLISADGTLLERLDASWGVPAFNAFGAAGDQLVLVSQGQAQLFSLESLDLLGPASMWQPARAEPVDQRYNPLLAPLSVPAELSWERLLQDLHSGRLFGDLGRWLMDLAALVLVLLGLSGVIMWWRIQRRA